MAREFMALTCFVFLALAYVRSFRKVLARRAAIRRSRLAGWQ